MRVRVCQGDHAGNTADTEKAAITSLKIQRD
jgi:hypothetical protein